MDRFVLILSIDKKRPNLALHLTTSSKAIFQKLVAE